MSLQAFYAVDEKFIIESEVFKVDEDQGGGLHIFCIKKVSFFCNLKYTEILLFPRQNFYFLL
jgi:hypothetical protein